MAPLGIAFLDITHPHVWTRADILRERDDVRLVGVYEAKNQKGAQDFAARYGCRIDSAEHLLADPAVQAVIVESYTNEMADWTIRALQAGKAVLLEKPASNNVANLQRIADAAGELGGLVQVGYMCRQSPIVDEIKTMLERGMLGRLTTARFHVAVPAPDALTEWFKLPWDIGGVLLEDGCHMLDIVHYLFGKPRRVTGFCPKYPDLSAEVPYEDSCVAALEWDTHCASFDLVGWEANDWLETWEIDLYGTEGTVMAGISPACYRLYLKQARDGYKRGWNEYRETNWNTPWIEEHVEYVWHAVKHRSFFRRELDRFLEAVRAGERRSINPPEDALAVIQVVDAIYRSAREGRAVEVP